MPTMKQYDEAFDRERRNTYPEIDRFEREIGFAINKDRLEYAARVLACPVKKNPPSWQHGRLVYSLVCSVLSDSEFDANKLVFVDVGTAKGFSAVMMALAIHDHRGRARVLSVDRVDPNSRTTRNSVAELVNLKTVPEFVEPFLPPGVEVDFIGGGSSAMFDKLAVHQPRVPFAFIDGSHSYDAVLADGQAIASLQQPGDIAVFDDLQIDKVRRAVSKLSEYDFTKLSAGSNRTYGIGQRLYHGAVV